MLTAAQFDNLTVPIVDLYNEYIDSVIADIARRLTGMDMTSAAAWQTQRIIESGALYQDVLTRLATLTGKSEATLRETFRKAGVSALEFDDRIYKAAGLNPVPLNLSPAMQAVLLAGLEKTGGIMRNLTMTTALTAQQSFIRSADLAYLQVSQGALSYDEAIRRAVKDVAGKGVEVIDYASGHRDQLDVAMRRTVLTGVGQTAGKLQETRADEMGQDLVETSAHIGARPSHQEWQGRVFSRSGRDPKYPDFVQSTGYGTGAGLQGWNCRHSWYPFFAGISERIYKDSELETMAGKTIKYNGQDVSIYDATQIQRGIERKIRFWKREAGGLEAGKQPNEKELGKVREWQLKMRDFINQMNKQDDFIWYRQRVREQI